MTQIAKIIRQIAKNDDEVYSITGVVKNIDPNKGLCDVEPHNGKATILDVRLQANPDEAKGVLIVPKDGSDVIVTFLNQQTGYLALCSEVEKVIIKIGEQSFEANDSGFIFNGGQLGGLVKSQELALQLNKLVAFLTALKGLLSVPVAEPGNGAPSVFQQTLNAALSNLELGDFSQIENPKITQ